MEQKTNFIKKISPQEVQQISSELTKIELDKLAQSIQNKPSLLRKKSISSDSSYKPSSDSNYESSDENTDVDSSDSSDDDIKVYKK